MAISIDRRRLLSLATGGGALLALLATIKVAVHLLTATGYGYFIDELYYLGMQRHLDFGYVDVPPLVPALMAVSNGLLGTSLQALHVFPAIAGALTLVVVGLTARELGGGRFAQFVAGLAILVSPSWLAIDSWFAYDAFDQLVTAFLFWAWVRRMKEETPRRWLVVGLLLGIGLLTKMSIVFTWPALAVALLLTSRRRSFLTPWPWLAAGAALLVASPFILWQGLHGFPIVTYWANYAQFRVHPAPEQFIVQVLLGANPIVVPLAILGLLYYLLDSEGKRYRTLGLVFLFLAALFTLVLHTEARMLISAFLPLFAGGAVYLERLLASGAWRVRLKPALAGLLIASGLVIGPAALPIGEPATWSGSSLAASWMADASVADNPGEVILPEYLYLRVGWPEMVEQVAQVYADLPAEEKSRAVIFAGTYGEAGAIDFFGPKYGLPPAISNHNAYQAWGPGDRAGDVVIFVGRRFTLFYQDPRIVHLEELYDDISFAGVIDGAPGAPYWERQVPIYVCRQPRVNLKDIWSTLADYS